MDIVFKTLFEGFKQSTLDRAVVFNTVTDMYRWLQDKPGYTGKLHVIYQAGFNLDGIRHWLIEFEATDYDSSIASTIVRLNENPKPYGSKS